MTWLQRVLHPWPPALCGTAKCGLKPNRLTVSCGLHDFAGVSMPAVVKFGSKPATCCAGPPVSNLSQYAVDISQDPGDPTLYWLKGEQGTRLLSDPQDGIGRVDNWLEESVVPFFGRSKLVEQGVAQEPFELEGPSPMLMSGLVKVRGLLHTLKTACIQRLLCSVLGASGISTCCTHELHMHLGQSRGLSTLSGVDVSS